MKLYHYTCEHTYAAIGERGTLLPMTQLLGRDALTRLPTVVRVRAAYVWLTDLDTPDERALGFTDGRCDRTRYRYRAADDTPVVTFQRWARTLRRDVRRDVLVGYVYDIRGARPGHWYLSAHPVPVELDNAVRR